MRLVFVLLLLVVGIAFSGTACRSTRTPRTAHPKGQDALTPTGNVESTTRPSPMPIVTPSKVVVGKIQTVNAAGRFAVVTFPIGLMPAAETHLNAYRAGLKVGELKFTAMRLDLNAVADIVAGECQPGDEVKD